MRQADNRKEKMMNAKEKKAVKMVAMNAADWCTAHGNGTFTARTGYFYTHGKSQNDLEASLKDEVPGFMFLESGNMWRAWPRDSFWWVRFEVDDPSECVRRAEELAQNCKCSFQELWLDYLASHEPLR
jgi:hypothetical protein